MVFPVIKKMGSKMGKIEIHKPGKSFSSRSENFLRSSIGVGLSWISPLGPLSISYAQPITNKSSDDIEQFNFKIGSAF